VRKHGSNAARIRAPPFSIVDGPRSTVADCGGQSGVAVIAPAKFCTVNPPSFLTVTWLLLMLVMMIGVGGVGVGDGDGLGDGDGDGLGDGDGDGLGDGDGDGLGDGDGDGLGDAVGVGNIVGMLSPKRHWGRGEQMLGKGNPPMSPLAVGPGVRAGEAPGVGVGTIPKVGVGTIPKVGVGVGVIPKGAIGDVGLGSTSSVSNVGGGTKSVSPPP
jgi:hypothetical protein